VQPLSDVDTKVPRATSGFRADVQALRALAVLLVVLYHAHIPAIHGGFFGVDVFFVVSGFVITLGLLGERDTSNRTSLIDFYARRARRIVPAACLVLLVTVLACAHWLGGYNAHRNAIDAVWAALFFSNIHFARLGTDYFGSQLPASSVQQFWSLGVEEQFYLVWPVVFMVTCRIGRAARRGFLAVILSGVVLLSLLYSVVETSRSVPTAFFSPVTHAWELAFGALIAVGGPWLAARRSQYGGLGLALAAGGYLVLLAATWFITDTTTWPGLTMLVPGLATGAVIIGGSLRESPLRSFTDAPVVQWLGRISYSLYLVHWPLLIIAAQYAIRPLALWAELLLVLASIALAGLLQRTIEEPLRRSSWLRARPQWSLVLGGILVVFTAGALVALSSLYH